MGPRGVARAPEPALLASEGMDAESEASMERAQGRMPVASVRLRGTGNPEPSPEDPTAPHRSRQPISPPSTTSVWAVM
jgi:hypothetical protein